MKVRSSAVSDTGRKRKGNEDSFLVDERLHLYAVCDGMGGHAAGEVASSMSVRVLEEAMLAHTGEIAALADGGPTQRTQLKRLMKRAVRRANSQIYKSAQQDEKLRGMGTTLTCMLLAGSRAFVAHVGDSRLYLQRGDQVHQITSDHSLVNEMIRAGSLEPEEVDRVPFTNALTRAVGVYPNVAVDTLEVELMPGDSFMLCTDGLHGYLKPKTLELGFKQTLEERSQWYVDFANQCGGKDNITVVAIEVDELGVDSTETQRLRLTLDTLRKIPLFQHLTYAELVHVINASRAREVPAGEVIIEQGSEGDALYVVLQGKVRVEQSGVCVATLEPGRHFGEMSLVDNEPRSASVVADERSLLIRMVRQEFYELMRQDSVLAVKLLWNFIQTLSARLRTHNLEAVESVADLDFTVDADPITSRTKNYGYDAFAKTDPRIELPDVGEIEDE